ncbi:GNAT family N-acetyltransferase [Shewanella gaetbuli]|uniref:GNAT family N-acetyltransferase n=1 Tax=Shewanella gaetbuli TaxID=220752 RepID=A0A9X1ZHE8_9GAMM|nr:GNAT family N-acetyltransferase [Shewanella gaetbuli]MCL1141596.1 GNAT family N-acetyltransferase [Shewanella gaetbuli]
MNFHIRKARLSDAQQAFDIRNRAIMSQCISAYGLKAMQKWTDGDLPSAFAEAFAANGYVMLNSSNTIIATGMIDLQRGFVDALFVEPDYLNLGIGRKMLNYLEQLALNKGVKQLTLESTLNAKAFYQACGFMGDEVSVYHSPRGFDLDCVVMTKQL